MAQLIPSLCTFFSLFSFVAPYIGLAYLSILGKNINSVNILH